MADVRADPNDADDGDAAVYQAHAARLVALAAALAGPSSAEDVVSAAVLRAMASPAWADVRDPGAYLTQAVVNEVRSHHRSALRRAAREHRAARPDRTEDAIALPDVLDALAALPLRQRAVTFLTYWADLTPAAVAEALGISEGSVRKHLARARDTLRKELA